MIEFKSVEVKNLIVYKEAKFDFVPGIHVIRGANRSGKSLLFSTLGNVFYSAPPLDGTKNSAKKLHDKGSSIKVTFNKDSIVQRSKGKGIGYEIVRNGKEKHVSRISSAKDYIEKIFPLLDDHFYTTVYLNAFRSHTLLHGKAAQRHEFFENIFDLRVYDRLQQTFSKKALDCKYLLRDLETLELERKTLEPKTKNLHLKDKCESLNAKYKKLIEEKSSINRKLQKCSANRALLSSLKTDKTTRELETIVGELPSKIKALRAKRENCKSYEQDLETFNEKSASNKKIEKGLASLSTMPFKEAKKKFDAIDLDSLEDELVELRSKYDNWKQTKDLELKTSSFYKEKALKNKMKMAQITETFAKLKKVTFVTCPTCMQEVDKSVIQRSLESLSRDFKVFKSKYKKFSGLYDLSVKKEQSKGFKKSRYKELPSLIEDSKKKLEKFERLCEEARKREVLESKLCKVSKPKKPDDYVSSKELQSKIDTLSEKLVQAKNDLSILEKVDTSYSEKDYKRLKKKDTLLNEEVVSINDKLQNMRSLYSASKTSMEALEDINTKLKSISAGTKNAKYYEMLSVAYGARGIRVLQVQSLVNMFVENLNRYSPLLFSDPIRFTADVGPGKFNIVAFRNNKSSDVNLLSGSESRCFQLLCCLSIIPFIPKKMRTNLLVLDEMETAMDKKTRRLFTEEFIPKIQKLVPCVVVISPLSSDELSVPNVIEYKVEKVNGVSRLLKV